MDELERGEEDLWETAAIVESARQGDDGKTRAVIHLIREGFGNQRDNHYYDAALLENVAEKFIGAKMFKNHLTRQQEQQREGMPRDIQELGGVIDRTWVVEEGGVRRIKGECEIVDPTIAYIARRRPDLLEVSINARGPSVTEMREGRQAKVVKDIRHVRSVDWVSQAGAGGKIERLLEAAAAEGDDEVEPSIEQDIAAVESELDEELDAEALVEGDDDEVADMEEATAKHSHRKGDRVSLHHPKHGHIGGVVEDHDGDEHVVVRTRHGRHRVHHRRVAHHGRGERRRADRRKERREHKTERRHADRRHLRESGLDELDIYQEGDLGLDLDDFEEGRGAPHRRAERHDPRRKHEHHKRKHEHHLRRAADARRHGDHESHAHHMERARHHHKKMRRIEKRVREGGVAGELYEGDGLYEDAEFGPEWRGFVERPDPLDTHPYRHPDTGIDKLGEFVHEGRMQALHDSGLGHLHEGEEAVEARAQEIAEDLLAGAVTQAVDRLREEHAEEVSRLNAGWEQRLQKRAQRDAAYAQLAEAGLPQASLEDLKREFADVFVEAQVDSDGVQTHSAEALLAEKVQKAITAKKDELAAAVGEPRISEAGVTQASISGPGRGRQRRGSRRPVSAHDNVEAALGIRQPATPKQ